MDPMREGSVVFESRRVARTDSLMETLHLNMVWLSNVSKEIPIHKHFNSRMEYVP